MHALLIGATGATGKDLLDSLLQDESIHRVDIFVRRNLTIVHPKLRVHIIDFDRPDQWVHLVKGDVLFSCLGTTLKMAGSKEAQWKIDFEYQYAFAKAAADNRMPVYVLVSSTGSNPDSLFFYPKMKGKLEAAVKALGFSSISIFNPPLLIRKATDRSVEKIMKSVLTFVNRFGLLISQKPLSTEVLAKAMIQAAKDQKQGIAAYKEQEIWELAG
jgi:uncharacterized protein YbjT (DUF2867 family)